MGDLSSDSQQEANLFFLSLLMSTIFVYNGNKVFTSMDFDHLSSLLKLTERIKIREEMKEMAEQKAEEKAKQKAEEKAKLIEELPKFIWLLRDFQSILDSDLTIEKMLNKELAEQIPNDDLTDVQEIGKLAVRNRIRAQIRSSFKSIEAITISAPQPQFTAELNQYELSNLGHFGKEVTAFVEKAVEMAKSSIKKIDGKEVKGVTFARLFKELVECLNSNKTVYLHSSYESIIKQLSSEKLKEAKLLLQTKTEQIKLPMEVSQLNSEMKKISNDALSILHESLTNNELTKAIEIYNETAEEQFDKIEKRNNDKIYAYNVEKVLDPRFNAIIEQINNDTSIKSYEKFESKLKELREFSASFFEGDAWKMDAEEYEKSKKDQIDILEKIVQKNSQISDGNEKDQANYKEKGYISQIAEVLVAAAPLAEKLVPIAKIVGEAHKPTIGDTITKVFSLVMEQNPLKEPEQNPLRDEEPSSVEVQVKLKN